MDNVREVINLIAENSEQKNESNDNDLPKIIEEIKVLYHRDWEKNKLEFAKNLLSRTWAGIPLPVLSLCGRGTQEIRYSKYLKYFLDSSKPHGLGTRYLDGILELLNFDKIETYNSLIESEKWIGRINSKGGAVNCYCDIFIECKTHFIFIEQKIGSGESVNPKSESSQLIRYDEAIKNNPDFSEKDQIRIYLTPTGKLPRKSPHWQSLSYSELVDTGIHILHSSNISYTARENLKRFLLDMLIGPFKKTEEEIQNLVAVTEQAVINPNFINRLNFDQIVSKNSKLIEILLEG